ncbi:cytochrome aa3 quinol oxidase subunit II [Geomicrobium sediminis]|uniref:Quinol oxidase subunit 2 n=1 Tax=Geomicrobium sediminis TaxID=1347788 RepID=A0ABS2PG05_9BACL|nr:cytochrome aa3 quinol oxidase subunit II [Geomicrobium sediminis]MBM7633985.1 cytochrome aa3-600 menaquinol oxidase subunit 2 [Geomicrobium sediminis]
MKQSYISMFGLLCLILLSGCNLAVLDPQGPVASQQKDLIWLSIVFMFIIVLIVFTLLVYFLVKYRERKGHDDYDPDIHGNNKLEILWTVIPIIIVTILSFPTVITIFNLEEAPEAESDREPLVIHATSASWKWIFSYPEEDIQTVNYVNIPVERPVLFKLTSADSMASFWVPQLGGESYSMAGMQTELYLQASEEGTYSGRNSNFTGEGFADMRFDVHAIEEPQFDAWVKEIQEGAPELTQERYDEFMLPTHVGEYTFSNTHLDWVDHSTDAEYGLDARERQGYEPENPNASDKGTPRVGDEEGKDS